MRLYRLIIGGRAHYVGTQSDARARKRETGASLAEVDVPTHKLGLIAFLNSNAAPVASTREPMPTPALDPAPVAPPPRQLPVAHGHDAASILARMDNPDLPIDAIVEAIAGMKGGYALKRVAGAVAIRFEELSRGRLERGGG